MYTDDMYNMRVSHMPTATHGSRERGPDAHPMPFGSAARLAPPDPEAWRRRSRQGRARAHGRSQRQCEGRMGGSVVRMPRRSMSIAMRPGSALAKVLSTRSSSFPASRVICKSLWGAAPECVRARTRVGRASARASAPLLAALPTAEQHTSERAHGVRVASVASALSRPRTVTAERRSGPPRSP